VCLQLQVQLVDNKTLNTASVTTTRGSTSEQHPLIRQVCLQLHVQLVDNKPLNKIMVSTTTGSISGQQNP